MINSGIKNVSDIYLAGMDLSQNALDLARKWIDTRNNEEIFKWRSYIDISSPVMIMSNAPWADLEAESEGHRRFTNAD
jgi:hypothetical protein